MFQYYFCVSYLITVNKVVWRGKEKYLCPTAKHLDCRQTGQVMAAAARYDLRCFALSTSSEMCLTFSLSIG